LIDGKAISDKHPVNGKAVDGLPLLIFTVLPIHTPAGSTAIGGASCVLTCPPTRSDPAIVHVSIGHCLPFFCRVVFEMKFFC
jgi:hypothetical protein